ncbi:expressed unknown protein [Seminavis robusta]|uniref:Uncharacterized protein n=1 Tax=Seminavis robusta TaxID=568900 RepID=A0A9N8HX11_9STRA|nr:expressed unknown protein [Seminavis robusta]|eukprot:Sro2330_g323560.1 n/a (328) ;mRNA; f:2935-4044
MPPFWLLLLLLLATRVQGQLQFSANVFPPTCDGCYCVVEDTNNSTCPSMPAISFNFTQLLKRMRWTNPIHLECNPYPYANVEGCTLTDSKGNNVEQEWGPEAVCGIRYDNRLLNQCYGSYTTESFETRDEAEQAGFTVTHMGACGTCSSTTDLAIYIETPDLQGPGAECGYISLSNKTAALECYKDIGFTKSCAATWLYDTTTNTRENCLSSCLKYFGDPPNLNESQCPLNECILCNEEISGPLFKKYAGRTRRGSGLLSYIVRNCSELTYDVSPLDPCPGGYLSGFDDAMLYQSTPSSSASQRCWTLWMGSFVAATTLLLQRRSGV